MSAVNYFAILNAVEPEEWVDPNAPPWYEDVAEGLAALGTAEEDEETVRGLIERRERESQRYLVRQDSGKLIKTRAEMMRCRKKGVPVGSVSYPEALALIAAEDQARNERHEKKLRRKEKRKR